jgi:flagellar motor protein MotB
MSDAGGVRVPVPDPTKLTQEMSDRLEKQLRRELDQRLQTVEAKLHDIERRAELAEKLRLELKVDNEKNIDKALTGVEKANEKLEASITRTLLQMSETAKSDNEGLRRDIDALKDRINDNKERVVGVEQQKLGATEQKSGFRSDIVMLVMLGGFIITALLFFASKGSP